MVQLIFLTASFHAKGPVFSFQRVASEMPQPIPIKDHEKETRLVNKRLMACALFVVAITCALVVRMYIRQVVEFDYHSTISENNRVHVLPITPTRGLIYDRNGVVLADNRPSYNLTITRERASDVPLHGISQAGAVFWWSGRRTGSVRRSGARPWPRLACGRRLEARSRWRTPPPPATAG